MDIAKIFERIKNVLFSPTTEWPAIAADSSPAQSIYTGHVLLLVALATIAGWIGATMVGSMFGAVGLGMGSTFFLITAVVNFITSFVAVWLVSWLANTLAPNFGGTKDDLQALKTVAYSWTASWVGSIIGFIPVLGWLLALAGAVYSIYLFYVGSQHTMKVPKDQAVGYTAVVIIAAIILMVIVGWITGAIAMRSASRAVLGSSASEIESAVAAAAKQAEIAAEAAANAGESGAAAGKAGAAAGAAAAAAAAAVLGSVTGKEGAVGRTAISTDDLKLLLPDTVGGMKRTSISVQKNNALGMQISQGEADYDAGDGRRIKLELTDTGGAAAFVALAGAAVAMGEQESETATSYSRTKRDGGRWFHEEWDKTSKSGEYSVFVADRFIVKAQGEAASLDQLKGLVAGIDLTRLESLKDTGLPTN